MIQLEYFSEQQFFWDKHKQTQRSSEQQLFLIVTYNDISYHVNENMNKLWNSKLFNKLNKKIHLWIYNFRDHYSCHVLQKNQEMHHILLTYSCCVLYLYMDI